SWLSTFLDASRKEKISRVEAFASYTYLKTTVNENEINLSGNTYSDSSDYLHSLQSQTPITFSIKKILPAKTAALIWFGVSDWNKYLPALRSYFTMNKMYAT